MSANGEDVVTIGFHVGAAVGFPLEFLSLLGMKTQHACSSATAQAPVSQYVHFHQSC